MNISVLGIYESISLDQMSHFQSIISSLMEIYLYK